MKNSLSGDERVEMIRELITLNNGYQIVHQAKRKEINEMYIEEYEKRKKEGPSYNTKNTNVYDYAFPNLTQNLVQKDYKKYNFEKTVESIDEMPADPEIDLIDLCSPPYA